MSHKFNIEGYIGQWSEKGSARYVSEQLKKADGGPITAFIRTGGGNVIEGMAIYNALKAYQGETTTLNASIAGSMGSVILQGGDKGKRKAYDFTAAFVHNASGFIAGNHHQLRNSANILEGFSNLIAGIYTERTGKTLFDAKEAMNKETFYIGGKQQLENGFIDEIVKAPKGADVIGDINEAEAIAKFEVNDAKAKLEKDPIDFKVLEKAAASLNIQQDFQSSSALGLDSTEDLELSNHKSLHFTELATNQEDIENILNQNSNQKSQESRIMNLEELKNSHPGTYNEVTALVNLRVDEAVKKEKSSFETRLEQCKNYLTADSLKTYASATPILIDVLKGESKLSSLTSMIAVIDQTIEKGKSDSAKAQSGELDATPGQQSSGSLTDENGIDKDGNLENVGKFHAKFKNEDIS